MDSPTPSFFDVEQASRNFKNLSNPQHARSCLEHLFRRSDQFADFLAFEPDNLSNVARAILEVHRSEHKPIAGVHIFLEFCSAQNLSNQPPVTQAKLAVELAAARFKESKTAGPAGLGR